MKTHVIILAKTFTAGHRRAGEPTHFKEKFLSGKKITTIRQGILWEKRIKEVQEGRAILSVREWSGKPYNSKQTIIKEFTHEDNLRCCVFDVDAPPVSLEQLAKNDGLEVEDFMSWFKNSKGLYTIIYF